MRFRVAIEYDVPGDYQGNKVADALRELAGASAENVALVEAKPKMAPIRVEGEKLICPGCGSEGPLQYCEDIGNQHRVIGIQDDGALLISGIYETDGMDDGTNPRLFCESCGEEWAIPDGLEYDFS